MAVLRNGSLDPLHVLCGSRVAFPMWLYPRWRLVSKCWKLFTIRINPEVALKYNYRAALWYAVNCVIKYADRAYRSGGSDAHEVTKETPCGSLFASLCAVCVSASRSQQESVVLPQYYSTTTITTTLTISDSCSRILPGSCVTSHRPRWWTFSCCLFSWRSRSSPPRIPSHQLGESA